MSQLAVVLGAGQIGMKVAELLLAQGMSVRVVRRGAPGAARPGLSWASGDLSDPAFAEQAAKGADRIFDCVNPVYTEWPRLLLPLGRGALTAARTSGARLIALDNLYMYGRPDGPMREDAPLRPCSKKGELRARLSELRDEAAQKGEVRLVVGRASDFFGPEITLTGVFGDLFFQRVLAGKSAQVIGDPDVPHSYSYGPDVARGLVALGADPDAEGVFHLPVNPAESTRRVIERMGEALARRISVSAAPDFVMRALGWFSPMMREVAEMTYQWRSPFALDDTKFRARFGFGATPWDEAIGATAAWAKRHYAPERSQAA